MNICSFQFNPTSCSCTWEMQGMAEPVNSAAYGGGRTQAQKFQCPHWLCSASSWLCGTRPGAAALGPLPAPLFQPCYNFCTPKGQGLQCPHERWLWSAGHARWGFRVGKHPRAVSEVNPNLVRSMVGLHRLLRKWNSGYVSLQDVSLSVFPFHPFIEYTERCYIAQLKWNGGTGVKEENLRALSWKFLADVLNSFFICIGVLANPRSRGLV